MPSPEKFRDMLSEFAVDESIVREINAGYENVVSKANKKVKSAYMKHVPDVMNDKLPK